MKVNGYEIEPCAELRRSDLSYADLHGADLRGANLEDADLSESCLGGANLRYAYLSGADLSGADLSGANLSGANLIMAYLSGAYLSGANLTNTVLDPMRLPNGDASAFEQFTTRSGLVWCKGYRTHDSPVIGGPGYDAGRWYTAPWFSVCSTPCHPGLYVRPGIEEFDIVVWFFQHDCHHAGDKWRVRSFFVEDK
jgi:hypothetical protein